MFNFSSPEHKQGLDENIVENKIQNESDKLQRRARSYTRAANHFNHSN
jgi:hypothetical protein